jgi:starch phosphorylase
MNPLEPFIHTPRIAYFSMEVALRSEIPTYSGGLGVLAGDTLRAGADLELPLVGVTLVSRMGYFRQEIDAQGRQVEHPDPWHPEQWATPLQAKIAVPIEDHDVWVQAWMYSLQGGSGYQVPVILLDTDLPENSAEDRTITHYLYGGDEAYRLKQEVVLGIGGARMLQALGFKVHTYHMNEGHSALLGLELLWRFERRHRDVGPGESIYNVARVRELCLFTTHTPVEAGHDQFPYSLVERVLDDFIEPKEVKLLAGMERLNMTRLALNLSSYVNGVAKSHAVTSNHMFPGYSVHSITNGIHPPTWASSSLAGLYDAHLPDWRHEPEVLVRVDQIPDAVLWDAHVAAKRRLVEKVYTLAGVELDPDVPIIGFARRMTAYKRPDLLFTDLERLRRIAARFPVQIVVAGKAHPRDEAGKRLIEDINHCVRELADDVKAAYLPDYDMALGLAMVSGSDIWLNTPLRPREASGTSGMKAALNGVPNLSVLDGWWAEGWIEGVTGWAIGSGTNPAANGHDAQDLYDKLEATVLPLYYTDRDGWLRVMKGAITKNAYYFNSHRMMRRYATEAYIR